MTEKKRRYDTKARMDRQVERHQSRMRWRRQLADAQNIPVWSPEEISEAMRLNEAEAKAARE